MGSKETCDCGPRRHFPDHHVRRKSFPGDPDPIHIGAPFTLRHPDLILNNPLRPQPEDQRGMFEANGREIEYVAHPTDKTAMS